ncbi:TfoX/Sxy family DNA transformation protein [Serratia sp. M24T3]|uniref:TfoX/Sxy family DNA transformation protein n=2 Tax=Yersiniaceae TaxID=1903411 RepID=A0AB39VNN8_9GAMM|nr:competence-specific genes regulator [Serratia sp. M24T3]
MLNATKARVAQAIKVLIPLGLIQSRPQFGGYSLSSGGAMFALVAEGELYLRATHENEAMMKQLAMRQFIYPKRGIEISLRYFQVDEALWQQPQRLIELANDSIAGMHSEQAQKKNNPARLKDLPNISLSMERLLWQVGVKSFDELRSQGAINTYVKLTLINKKAGLNMLFALEGAILGYHQTVLPDASRHELINWFNLQRQEGQV